MVGADVLFGGVETRMSFAQLSLALFIYMTILWLLRKPLRNDSLVDFGWPSSFAVIGLFYGLTGDGTPWRRWTIAGMYMFCGARMAVGFAVRTFQLGADRRFDLWRAKWQAGDGLFGVKSPDINFFIFYHVQYLANVLVISIPVRLLAFEKSTALGNAELFAAMVWLVSFVLENVADLQLYLFRLQNRGTNALLESGLWRYSRHPNYFFEFLIWTSYSVAALPLAVTPWDVTGLLILPPVAYWFLVYFTGIPMTEQASLTKRGEIYRSYQRRTSRFFPRPPRKL